MEMDAATGSGACMKTIQVYDPPMCCSTGICGTEIDPLLVRFAALLGDLGRGGVSVQRFNLGQQPLSFLQNTVVKDRLDKGGVDVLPLILVDGEVYLEGRYPSEVERERLRTSAVVAEAGVVS